MNKLEEIASLYEDLDKKVANAGESLFKEFFTEIFESAPEIKAVHWRQYIPGFNDGEPCEFSFYDIDLLIEGINKKPDSEWVSETAYDYMGENDEVDAQAMSEDYPQFMGSDRWYQAQKDFKSESSWSRDSGWKYTTSDTPDHICDAVARIHTTVFNNKQACQAVFGSNAEILITPQKITIDDFECGW